jgi:hypothetical protein
MTVEFDKRCATTQIEDCVVLYTDPQNRHPVGKPLWGFKESSCWPTGALVVPGHHLSVVFESATDYGGNAEAVEIRRWGMCVHVTGHEFSPSRAPLLHVAAEVSHAAGIAASSLLLGDVQVRACGDAIV